MSSRLSPLWLRDPDDEASHWFARLLDPDCDDAERASFERWRSASPVHAAAYRDFEALWADGAAIASQPAIAAATSAALHDDASARRTSWLPAFAVAALLLVAVSGWFGWLAWQSAARVPGVRYATTTGQQRNVQLPDGSAMLLDTDSAVTVQFTNKARNVELRRGRVQFDVRHDASRPFVVDAEDGAVTDIGTVFQMQLDEDAVDVVLLKGEVSITTKTGSQTRTASLRTGERLRYRRDGAIGPVEPVDALVAEGWTHGKLFVHDWSLPQLLAAMNRYSDTKLEIEDPALRNVRISGVFKTDDQQTLLQILREGWSLRTDHVSAKKIVLSRADATSTSGNPDSPRR